MLTRCPSCQTIFRLDAETLAIAQGQVRCGRCAVQFDGLDNVLEQEPSPLAEAAAAAEAPAHVMTQARHNENVIAAESEATEAAYAASAQSIEPSAETDFPERMIVPNKEPVAGGAAVAPLLSLETIQQSLLIEDQAQPREGLWRLGGMLLVLLLLALLLAQWVYMQRVPLYAQPVLRPVLKHFCAVVGCDLPLLRAPERIDVLDRSVREHPRVAGALLANVSIISRADQPIAYPLVVMQLGDVSGNRVVGRRFTPAEYLPPGVDIRVGMQPGQVVQIALELAEPKLKTVSFHFEFY